MHCISCRSLSLSFSFSLLSLALEFVYLFSLLCINVINLYILFYIFRWLYIYFIQLYTVNVDGMCAILLRRNENKKNIKKKNERHRKWPKWKMKVNWPKSNFIERNSKKKNKNKITLNPSAYHTLHVHYWIWLSFFTFLFYFIFLFSQWIFSLFHSISILIYSGFSRFFLFWFLISIFFLVVVSLVPKNQWKKKQTKFPSKLSCFLGFYDDKCLAK